MALQLRDNINIPQSVRQLRSCTTDLCNIVTSPPVDDTHYQNSYMNVVERVEPQLRNIFMDPIVWNHLYGDCYWTIRAVGEAQGRGKHRSMIAADRSVDRPACDCTTEIAHG